MASTSGVSVLPHATARRPDATSISVTMVVTVVLPSVPVMATIGRSSQRAARSNSDSTGTPARSAATKAGWRSGTPGLGRSASAPASTVARSCSLSPSSTSTPSDAAAAPDLVGGMVVDDRDGDAVGLQGLHHGPAGDPEAEDHDGGQREVVGGQVGHQSSTPGRLTKSA